MKAHALALPHEVAVLNEELESNAAELAKIADNIVRAKAVVAEAERHNDEVESVTRARAESRAHAFVDGTAADLAELDRQLEALAAVGRQVREDADSAALAITLLEAKRDELNAARAALIEKRKQVVIDWLTGGEDAATHRHIKSVTGLKDDIVEASACDRVRQMLGGSPGVGIGLLKAAQACDFAIPRKLWLTFDKQPWRPPVAWLQSHFDTGKPQDHDRVEELLALLRKAGVIT